MSKPYSFSIKIILFALVILLGCEKENEIEIKKTESQPSEIAPTILRDASGRQFSVGRVSGLCPYAQIALGWYSPTHQYRTTPPWNEYRFTPTIPYGSGTSEMGNFINDYRISFASGEISNTYSWALGVDSVTAKSIVYLYKSSNGLPSSVTTNLGTLTTNGSTPSNNIVLTDGVMWTNHDLIIPANPYTDRTLTFVVHATAIYQYVNDCGGLELPIQYAITDPSDIDYGINQMIWPWVEIRVPPNVIDPTEIPGLHAWYKWNTGVTSASGVASSWADQSGNGYTMYQNTASYKPAYNATSGAFSPDGINDSFRANAVINETGGEVTAVIEVPTTMNTGVLFSKSTSPGSIGDDNNISFMITSGKTLYKVMAVGTGQVVASNNTLTSNTKVIVSFSGNGTTTKLWINGVQCSYSIQSNGNWLVSGNNTFMTLFSQARPGGHSFAGFKLYELSYHNHELTPTERANLTAYYKFIHGIL